MVKVRIWSNYRRNSTNMYHHYCSKNGKKYDIFLHRFFENPSPKKLKLKSKLNCIFSKFNFWIKNPDFFKKYLIFPLLPFYYLKTNRVKLELIGY